MKRILLIILMLIFAPRVFAYTANVSGVIVRPSPSSTVTESSCPTGAYYLAGQSNTLLGLRVSFYDKDGIQVGNTIDVWNNSVLSGNRNTEITGTTDARIANANGYTLYKARINHAYRLLSRIDYYRGFYFNLTGGDYYYYVDNETIGYALKYTKDAAKDMKTYFTTPDVVQRYMNITGASSELNIYQGDYVIVLETLVKVAACQNGTLGGVYTVADFGSLVNETYISNIRLRCEVVKYLTLAYDGNVGYITFEAPENIATKKCERLSDNYTPYEVTRSNLGVGMGFIYGTEVCKTNCTSVKKYKIIYHTIDLSSPFLDRYGDTRSISNESNWCQQTSSYSDTCRSTYYVDRRVYDSGPFLTVTLSPATISKIKSDNRYIDYSNRTNYTCSNFWYKFRTNSMFSPTYNFCY